MVQRRDEEADQWEEETVEEVVMGLVGVRVAESVLVMALCHLCSLLSLAAGNT